MTTPARLKYENSNNNEEIIGVFRPDDPTEGNIDTFTIDHDAIGYARVIIEGDPSLQRKMPVVNSDFGSSEREIIVEVDKQKNGTWEKRARVYPEGPGTTDDQGRYKHKNLWGFKRETGQDDVIISTAITTDIEEVLNEALPSNYTVVYPSDETPPSVNQFTYEGARHQLYSDLQDDYDHYIIFTPFTDGSGNIEVLLQPEGYGGVQFSLTRGQDPMVYDYFKPRDTSNVVSKVTVKGTTPSGVAVNETFTPSDYNDLGSPDKSRFISERVDWLGGTESEAIAEAKQIGKSLLNPKATTSLALDTTLRVDNNLNQSVGLIDDSRVVDKDGNTLDDVFTVVKQKDFLHEGLTYLSFEYEQESTKAQRRKWRKHDSQQQRLYPSNLSEEVGEQGLDNADTGGDTSNTERDPNDDGVLGNNSNTERDPNDDGVLSVNNGSLAENSDSMFNTETLNSGAWKYFGQVSLSTNAVSHLFDILVSDISSTTNLEIAITDGGGGTVWHHQAYQVGANNAEGISEVDFTSYMRETATKSLTGYTADQTVTYNIYVASSGSSTPDVTMDVTGIELNHTHPDDVQVIDITDHPHGDEIFVIDISDHGDSEGGGGHDVLGNTDSQTLENLLNELKTDRP